MRYVILQKTPFPGCWERMPTYQLQKAEYDLRLGRHYGERATRLKDTLCSDVLLYSWEDAQRIIDYWRPRKSWAAFKVLGFMQ